MATDAPDQSQNLGPSSLLSQYQAQPQPPADDEQSAGASALAPAVRPSPSGSVPMGNYFDQSLRELQQSSQATQKANADEQKAAQVAKQTRAQHLRAIGMHALQSAGQLVTAAGTGLGDAGAVGTVPPGGGWVGGVSRTMGARTQRIQETAKNNALIAETNARTRSTQATAHKLEMEDLDWLQKQNADVIEALRSLGVHFEFQNQTSDQVKQGMKSGKINPGQHVAQMDGLQDTDDPTFRRGTYSLYVPPETVTLTAANDYQKELMEKINRYVTTPDKQPLISKDDNGNLKDWTVQGDKLAHLIARANTAMVNERLSAQAARDNNLAVLKGEAAEPQTRQDIGHLVGDYGLIGAAQLMIRSGKYRDPIGDIKEWGHYDDKDPSWAQFMQQLTTGGGNPNLMGLLKDAETGEVGFEKMPEKITVLESELKKAPLQLQPRIQSAIDNMKAAIVLSEQTDADKKANMQGYLGNPNLTGQAFLNSLRPQEQGIVKMIGEGRMTLQGNTGRLAAQSPGLFSAVEKVYPNFSARKAVGFDKVYENFTDPNGKNEAAQLQSGGTAFKHLLELKKIADEFPGQSLTGMGGVGTAAYKRYQSKLGTIADELITFYGEAHTNETIKHYRDTLGGTNRDAAIKEQAKSMSDRFNSMEQVWMNAAPSDVYRQNQNHLMDMPYIDQEARDARAELDPDYAERRKRGEGPAPTASPAKEAPVTQGVPGSIQAPADKVKQGLTGLNYIQSKKAWYWTNPKTNQGIRLTPEELQQYKKSNENPGE